MRCLSSIDQLWSVYHDTTTNYFFKLGLPGIALVSLLSANPCLATVQLTNSSTSPHQYESLLANPPQILSQSIQIRIPGLPQRQQRNSRPHPYSGSRTRLQPSPLPANEELYQTLNRRSNESHEEWYSRIDPLIMRMPGQQYRAWKATLPTEDREAFDAITRQRNYEVREQMNQAIEDALTQPSQPSRVTRPNGMSESEWACYINPSCGR